MSEASVSSPGRGGGEDPREVLRTCHLFSIQPGHTRGNHYHPGHAEWLFTFHGVGILVWEAAGEIRERQMAGNRTLIRIPPGISHALTNPSPEVLYLLAWRSLPAVPRSRRAWPKRCGSPGFPAGASR